MSNQDSYYQQSQGNEAAPQQNPWATETSQQHGQQPHQPQQQQQYAAPSGYQAPPGPPPRRTNTFEETQLVPQSERGEQREAMEQFEMNRSKPESQTDRDVAELSAEFPGLDGSLIAALYTDTQSKGATREMLQELASGSQVQQ